MNRKKIIDGITYVVNILVALTVFGLISCAIFFLTYQFLHTHGNPSERTAWSFIIPSDLVLTMLWGRYQYRLLILKTPRPPHETRRNLLILAGCVIIAVLLIFGLVTYNKMERMEKAQRTLEQMKKLQLEKTK